MQNANVKQEKKLRDGGRKIKEAVMKWFDKGSGPRGLLKGGG